MLSQSNPPHPAATPVARAEGSAPRRLARRASASEGFSLPEVLVVILILGVLAAIAIPAFLSTTTSATDVQAKELVRNAESAAETFAEDHGGSYAEMTTAGLAAEDGTIATTASTQHAWLSSAKGSASEYTLTATATNKDVLTITRTADGSVSRTCHSAKSYCSGAENSSW
jgi:type IV pilus assembly protein PilA